MRRNGLPHQQLRIVHGDYQPLSTPGRTLMEELASGIVMRKRPDTIYPGKTVAHTFIAGATSAAGSPRLLRVRGRKSDLAVNYKARVSIWIAVTQARLARFTRDLYRDIRDFEYRISSVTIAKPDQSPLNAFRCIVTMCIQL